MLLLWLGKLNPEHSVQKTNVLSLHLFGITLRRRVNNVTFKLLPMLLPLLILSVDISVVENLTNFHFVTSVVIPCFFMLPMFWSLQLDPFPVQYLKRMVRKRSYALSQVPCLTGCLYLLGKVRTDT